MKKLLLGLFVAAVAIVSGGDDNTFPTAKNSKICKKILDEKLYLKEFRDYVVYSDDNNSKIKHLVFNIYGGTSQTPSFFYRKIIDGAFDNINETEGSDMSKILDSYAEEVTSEYDKNDEEKINKDVDIDAQPWAGYVEMFLIDNVPYLNLHSHPYSSFFAIYAYNKEAKFFDQACKIEKKIVGYKKENKICKQVLDKKYKKIQPNTLHSVLNKKQIRDFNYDFYGYDVNDNSLQYDGPKALEKYNFTSFQENSTNTYLADYRNEGKKHIILNLQYHYYNRAGCSYNFLAVYSPKREEVYYIGEEELDINFFPSHFSDCFFETKEEIVSINQKNYILVSGLSGIVGLYEITKSDNATDNINQLCKFEPIYKYE
ncbi:MAG: hypothetical protein LBS73_05310 [Campylobacteraceae bacterium]|jgi:hypothetical protein|nr:hypothetical protein [Campylobacteraceae bacterium]